MITITSGRPFIDIDAYACCVAYAELLRLQGKPARAVTTSTQNNSIPKIVRDWQAPLEQAYTPRSDDQFVLVDLSDPQHMDLIVRLDKVIEVIDHHPGQEAKWTRPGVEVCIEFVGAAATLIFEKWQRSRQLAHMSQLSARLLMCAILDNTLNFQAHVTHQRDRQAYAALQHLAQLPADWPAQYFEACQQAIASSPAEALKNDSKILEFQNLAGKVYVGQLVAWDASELIRDLPNLIEAINAQPLQWFINIVSIKDGQSNFVCDNPDLRAWLSRLCGVRFQGNLAAADRLWLRKEIIKQSLES